MNSWVRNPRSLRFKSLVLTVGALTAPILLLTLYYGVREHTLSTALLLLPVGVVIAWWMGRRMVRPLELLREQVLARARAAEPGSGLSLGRRDEFGDLSDAFDTLLAALQRRSKATEAFVADVAHELKNPIAALRAAAEMVETTPLDPEKAQRLAKVMHASCTRLDQRVSELLELARVEAGLTEREPVDLVLLARGMIDAFTADPRYQDRTFVLDAPPSLVLELATTRFESALRNLVDNAASFAGAGGKVSVCIARSDQCTITVKDSGPGIAAEDAPRIFDRFFSTRQGGTGLGLALTRAIIEAHGGVLTAESPPGSGAVFTARLPLSQTFHIA